MLFVIDAFNLIYAHEPLLDTLDARGFPAVRDTLVRVLAAHMVHAERDRVVLVFDGSPKAGGGMRHERASGFVGASKIELIFSDPDLKADRTILDLVEAAKRPGEITVVSDDKFVTRGVKSAQGRTLGCRAFLKLIHLSDRRRQPSKHPEDPRKYRGLAASEIQEWMDYFGFKDDE